MQNNNGIMFLSFFAFFAFIYFLNILFHYFFFHSTFCRQWIQISVDTGLHAIKTKQEKK